jgi:glycosidase
MVTPTHNSLPTWAEHAIIYSVNTRQFTPEGTFHAFATHLPRLKELGVNVLWFMPIHPIGEKKRKGSLGSYYSIKDYYGINPEFGTLENFRALVQKIHEMDMHLIIDLVANHTAWDNPMIEKHPEWYRQNKKGKIIAPFDEWLDVAQLDYSDINLRHYMTEMMRFWIEDVGIDGFRCDVAEMVPMSFWASAITELQNIKPILMLAEGQHPVLHQNGFHLSYAFNMYWLFNGIVDGSRDLDELDTLLDIDTHKYPAGSRRLRYTSNHDQNSWIGTAIERLGAATKVMAVLTFTLPGTPLIYNGQEVGLNKRLSFYEKDEIEWRASELTSFYQTLCHVYKNHPALFKGDMKKISTDAPDQIYAFTRSYADDFIVMVANLSDRPVTANLKIDINEPLEDIFHHTPLHAARLALDAWDFRIYQKK